MSILGMNAFWSVVLVLLLLALVLMPVGFHFWAPQAVSFKRALVSLLVTVLASLPLALGLIFIVTWITSAIPGLRPAPPRFEPVDGGIFDVFVTVFISLLLVNIGQIIYLIRLCSTVPRNP